MKDKIKNISKKWVIGSLLIFISVLIIVSIIWGNRTFSVKTLNQIIFHLKVPMEGTDNGIYLDWFIWSVPISLAITVIINIIIFNSGKLIKKYESKIFNFFKTHFIKAGVLCLLVSLIFTIYNYDIYGYINNMVQDTGLYEQYYVDPRSVNINF